MQATLRLRLATSRRQLPQLKDDVLVVGVKKKENVDGDEAEGEDVEGQEKQDLNLHTARATLIPT